MRMMTGIRLTLALPVVLVVVACGSPVGGPTSGGPTTGGNGNPAAPTPPLTPSSGGPTTGGNGGPASPTPPSTPPSGGPATGGNGNPAAPTPPLTPPSGGPTTGGNGSPANPTPSPTPPSGGPGGGVVTSPIRMPLPIDNLCCGPYARAKPRLEEHIRQACGNGELCARVVMVVDEDPSNDAGACESVRFVDKHYYIPGDRDRRPYVDFDRGGTVGIVVNVACGAGQPTTPGPEPANR